MENGRMALLERIVRGALGALLLAYYGFNTSAVWALVGVIPLLTAILNFCPFYLLRRRPAEAAAAGTSAATPAPEVPTAMLSSSAATATEAAPEVEPEEPARPQGKSTGHRKAKGKLRRARPAEGGEPTTGRVLHATDATFDKLVLESPVPVLVDFWAEWCGPCRALAPTIEELAREHKDQARVVKVDVERARQVAGDYGIRSIPTVAIFKGGEAVDVLVGLQSKDKLSRLLARAAS